VEVIKGKGMTYKARISKCKICVDEYLQEKKQNVICPKAECKAKNKKLLQKEHKQRVRNGEAVAQIYRPKTTDTSMPEVRFKNIFILGQYNACSFR